MNHSTKIIIICLTLLLLTGLYKIQESIGSDSVKTIKDISPEQWNNLSQQKIYFGHQSVGNNIIDGIKAVMKEHPEIKLKIVETRDFATIDVGAFFHSKIGKNEDPLSKTQDFVALVESVLGGNVDIAFHKYCYIDANARTDIDSVFINYKNQINQLKEKYPETNFIHITMPLTTIQTGLKAWVKKILGKPIGGIDNNIKRNEFNRQLLSTFQGKDPVFDLAAAETTRPDGTLTTFIKNGKEYLAMYKGYSNDGGHLNKQGQKVVAEQLLISLSTIE